MNAILACTLMFAGFDDAPPKEKPEPSKFEWAGGQIVMSVLLEGVEMGLVPAFSVWEKQDDPPEIKDFSKKLTAALETPTSADHAAAVKFVAGYVGMAQFVARSNGQSNLDGVAERMFGPQTKAIAARLEKTLDSANPQVRLHSAIALMAFRQDAKTSAITRAKAKKIFAVAIDCNDYWGFLGLMSEVNEEALDALTRDLRHKDADTREMAANSIFWLGSNAKSTMPALIRYLETGPDAVGTHRAVFSQARTSTRNLALAALSAMKADALPALPVIVRKFPDSKPNEQRQMLHCLANMGPAARAARPMIETARGSDHAEVKLAAACALLSLNPDDKDAAAFVSLALGDADRRTLALEICEEFGASHPAIVASVIPLLDHEEETTRLLASHAIASIGPAGAKAIPSLEKLLLKPADGSKHTFRSHDAAADALRKIGKQSIPALLRIVEAETGSDAGRYAGRSLAGLANDLTPDMIDRLIRRLDKKPWDCGTLGAVCVLGNLGDRARRARPALERLLGTEELAMFVAAALSHIPER